MNADASSGESQARDELPLDHWLAALSALPVHELSLTLSPLRPGALPEPLLIVIRSLVGEALRARRCLTGAPRCEGCPEAAQCDFDRVFERDDGAGQRPFWLRGLHAGYGLDGDLPLHVTLCLLDRERALLPDFLAALRHALGAVGDRDAPLNALGIPSRTAVMLAPPSAPEAPVSAVCIESLTPLLLRGDEALAVELCPGAPIVGLLLRAGGRASAGGHAPRRLARCGHPEGAVADAVRAAPPRRRPAPVAHHAVMKDEWKERVKGMVGDRNDIEHGGLKHVPAKAVGLRSALLKQARFFRKLVRNSEEP